MFRLGAVRQVRHGMVRSGEVRCVRVRQARLGTLRSGEVGQGKVRNGKAGVEAKKGEIP